MRRSRKKLRAPLAALAVVSLLAAGCGARLTKAQMEALDQTASGASAGSGSGGSSGSGSTGSGSGVGIAIGGGSGSSGGGNSGSSGSSGSSGGGSSVVTGGGGGSVSASGAGSGSGSNGGGSQITQAGNPLAGPGGKVCPPGAPGSGPGVTANSITVGNIATVNGPVPGLFAGARYGAQAVADYINSMGGICGRQLKVDSQDDQFDQATDQQEAASMSNSVLAFMGSFSLQDDGIPAGAPGVPDIGEALSASRFNASTNFSPQPQAPGYNTGEYIYIKSLPQYAEATQHMAMLIENTPATATTGAEEEAALQSVGYKFVFTDSNLQPTDPTFDNDVAKMDQAGVQGVVFQATATVMGQLAAQIAQDPHLHIVLGNWCPAAYDPAFIQNAGSAGTQGTLLSQSMSLYEGEDASTIPMVATLDQWYARVNPGQKPDIFAVYAWMSGLMLAQALNESGNVSRAGLDAGLQTLTNFDGDGLAAPANPVTKTPPTCWLLITVVNGHFARAPETPSGFKCSPAGYYHYTG